MQFLPLLCRKLLHGRKIIPVPSRLRHPIWSIPYFIRHQAPVRIVSTTAHTPSHLFIVVPSLIVPLFVVMFIVGANFIPETRSASTLHISLFGF
jgi:hypothetical protein